MDGFSRSTATIKPVLLPASSRVAPFFRESALSARSDPGTTEFRTAHGRRTHLVPSLHEHAEALPIRRPKHVTVACQQTKTGGTKLPRDADAQNKPIRQQTCTTQEQFSAYPSDAEGPASASEIAFFWTRVR